MHNDRFELEQSHYVKGRMKAASERARVQFRTLFRTIQMIEPDCAALVCGNLKQVEIVADPEDVPGFDLFLCEEALDCRGIHAYKLEHVGPI